MYERILKILLPSPLSLAPLFLFNVLPSTLDLLILSSAHYAAVSSTLGIYTYIHIE